MPSRSRRRIASALLVAAFVAGCTSDDDGALDDGADATDASVDVDDGAEADGADVDADDDGDDDGQAVEPPVSVVTVEPIDAPRSSAEIRVGEIIIEFDGQVTEDGTVLTLEEPILFDFDSATLRGGAREALDDVAEVLAFYEGAPVQVIGHTDDQGGRDYNLGLSQDRADAVVAGLRERGIGADRLTAEGRAFDEPVADNSSEAGRAQNRRVEVLIVGVTPPDQDG
ncbi:OmpA family protein [Nitriliruptor alkaliphilus]|uniref:OmpA family protein n=1 Tax=Nitriliruptor alkaliphilus TaxID=427918 RepID=UPI000A8A67A4|nr:OmpA family protein [Nitriliruptor alkaliphilus]